MKTIKAYILTLAVILASLFNSPLIWANDNPELEEIKAAIAQMRSNYEQRISKLESELEQAIEQNKAAQTASTQSAQTSTPDQANDFAELEAAPNNQPAETLQSQPNQRSGLNLMGARVTPNISVILDGQYADYQRDEEKELPGFNLAGEASERPDKGFAIGHTELALSANVDDKFYGKFTAALADHDGGTEIELEEAFIQSLGIAKLPGASVRAGRFFSAVGYLNEVHEHAQDFADTPLVYQGLWGKKYIEDGVRLSWVAPTETYIEVGTEMLSGDPFPGSDSSEKGIGAQLFYATIGDDINPSNSWQAHLSYHKADVSDRGSSGHAHGEEAHSEEEGEVEFSGDSDTFGIGAIYKWAPNGNYKNTNVKLQGEFFKRREDGDLNHNKENSTFDSDQYGYYLQAVYQFHPQWRTGMRYDHLQSSSRGSDAELIEEAGRFDEDIDPERTSAMLEWLPSEFSRVRLQYNRDHSGEESENQYILQYTMSLGDHGAHEY